MENRDWTLMESDFSRVMQIFEVIMCLCIQLIMKKVRLLSLSFHF